MSNFQTPEPEEAPAETVRKCPTRVQPLNLPLRLLHRYVYLNGLFVVFLASNLFLTDTPDDPNLE